MSANGRDIPVFSGGNVVSPKQHNRVRRAVTALNNIQLKRVLGGFTRIDYSDKNVIMTIGDDGESAASQGTQTHHPFQIYQVPNDQVAPADLATPNKAFWAVRYGVLELRPQWVKLSASALGDATDNAFSIATTGSDNVGIDPNVGKLGLGGTYFSLTNTADVVGGINYGCQYGIYISITDTAANNLNSTPTVALLAQRFARGGTYGGAAWPQPTVTSTQVSVEIIPIGIIQILPDTNVGPVVAYPYGASTGFTPGDPLQNNLVQQIVRTDLVNRFSLTGMRYVGDFDTSRYRTYYPGDVVAFISGVSTDPNYGMWMATGIGANPVSTTQPTDNTSAGFFYFANVNPPSATNPP